MNVSVILCSYNRCRDLAKALDSVAASKLPAAIEWEVVVVDNNSSDQTREVVKEFCDRFPGSFRYVFEPQQGKSWALNAGIREALGEVLAFTDDDVTVDSTWLQNLTADLHQGKWVGAGGRIVLRWPPSVPNWLSKDGPHPRYGFPDFDLGPVAKVLPCPPLSANMAFRKSVFERYGGFRTDLGPGPGRATTLTREDAEFGRRLISAREQLRYEPSAVVYQLLPEVKINKEYLLARAYDKGRADVQEFRISRVRLICSLAAWILRWAMSIRRPVRFCKKLAVWEKAGTVVELNRRWREAREKRARQAEEIKKDSVNILGLKAGEWVEVRAREEILATLDDRGRLGNLPFMPEMLQYCGRRFRVFRRADKTCDNIEPWSIRRMTNAVLLEGVRCDGQGHGGCQARCMIFWKEAWLKRAPKDIVSPESLLTSANLPARGNGSCTVAHILNASSRTNPKGEALYSCQATELLTFTSYMRSWDPRQYIRDLRSGNLATGLGNDSRLHRALEVVLGILRILRSVAFSLFNTVLEKRPGRPTYPFLGGSAKNIPVEQLNLQPGELVQVKSKEEIIATLDERDRHRGLLFDGAMLTYCGGIYRVLGRVFRIVDEKTGKMLSMNNPCIVLEGVICRWDYHRLCPRDTCTPYWRENWLKRAVDLPAPLPAGQIVETCEKTLGEKTH
jgi:glycosyltransferase involved in cell wall biosynthesis